jgi:hypothetical protein
MWGTVKPTTSVLVCVACLAGAAANGQAFVLLPIDWVRRTSAADTTVREIASRARQELQATNLVIVLTGKASAWAAKELAVLGWSVTES